KASPKQVPSTRATRLEGTPASASRAFCCASRAAVMAISSVRRVRTGGSPTPGAGQGRPSQAGHKPAIGEMKPSVEKRVIGRSPSRPCSTPSHKAAQPVPRADATPIPVTAMLRSSTARLLFAKKPPSHEETLYGQRLGSLKQNVREKRMEDALTCRRVFNRNV